MLKPALILPVVLLAVPFAWDFFVAYELGLYLLYGIVGQGLVICWGRAGFLPLGQALFFGIGAYLSGYMLTTFEGSWTAIGLLLIIATLVPALIAGLVGAMVFNRQIGSGPYFSLITLALAMLGFQLANSADQITGGFNGMTGIPGLPGIDSYEGLYFVILAALAVSTLVVSYVLKAPFGQLLAAVAQNEERLQFFGFRTGMLKALAFAVSAALAGFAGALYAPHQGIVTPQAVGFLLSAELVIWSAVGGRNRVLGPVLGAVFIGFLATGLRDMFRFWEVVVALVFVVVVLRFPEGLSGLVFALGGRFGFRFSDRDTPARDIQLAAIPPGRDTVLRYDGVRVKIGTVTILNGLTVEISGGGIHCIIGPNGAGKTSAFNALTGKLPVAEGTIAWRGTPITGERAYRVAARGIGRKFQVPSVFPELSVGQNIDIALWANRMSLIEMFSMRPYRWNSTLLAHLEELFPFLGKPDIRAGDLSLGQRQMLEFALSNLPEPALLLLDEPCAGLSAAETSEMIEAIADLSRTHDRMLVIIEHDMQVVEKLSDHVIVLHQGRLLANGSLADIKQNADVQAVYAGGAK